MYSGFLSEPILPVIGIISEDIKKYVYNVNIVGIIVPSKCNICHFLPKN